MAGQHIDPREAVAEEEFASLSDRAGDVLVRVDAAGVCSWSSNGGPRPGTAVTAAFHPDDEQALSSLLDEGAGGPVWLRVNSEDDSVRWVCALAARGVDGAVVLQLRDAHRLDPTSQGIVLNGGSAPGREEALNEVAWLLSATPRTGKEIAVASVGLDRFSALNDTRGQEAGDEVLRIVTGRISDALRSGDLVSPLERDQLLVILRGVHHLRGAIRVANKIRTAVEDPIPMPFGDVIQTASIGVTLISRGESVDSVLERAEGAMRKAKDAGRNTVMSSPPI